MRFPARLPVIAQKLIQQLQQAAVVLLLDSLHNGLLYELFCLLRLILFKKFIHLCQDPLNIHFNDHAFPH